MSKRFQFDDEDTNEVVDDQSYINEIKAMREHQESVKETSSVREEFDLYDEIEEDVPMAKKKKFTLEWWHYVLIAFAALIIAFMLYIFVLSNNEGPVYGSRCEGLTTTLSQDQLTSTTNEIKKKYSEVQNISLEVECKQLKVDILFKDKMDTKKAQSIAEETVQTLDKLVGKTKEKGKTYSILFGYENKQAQYEVNLFLDSSNSADFPIYGTKHVSKDSFAYTLSSVKDKDSKDKAEETLKK